MSAWDVLGIEPTQDIRAIKRAYSVKLKTTRPDDDAQAYQALREAYDWAQENAKFYAANNADAIVEPIIPTQQHEAAIAEPVSPVWVPAVPPPAAKPEPTPAADVMRLIRICKKIWAQQGNAGLVRAWPAQQAQLEELPITAYKVASQAFAHLVVEEPELPVEVLIALTRHFQWGLDFRADQSLGPQLSQALYLRLSNADVFAAFHPEKYTQFAWAMALAKLWEAKRKLWAHVLAAMLDYPTRQKILQARPSLLQSLGASQAASKLTQDSVARGGVLQVVFFVLLLTISLVFLQEPGVTKKSFSDVVMGTLLISFLFFGVYAVLAKAITFKTFCDGKNMDWVPLVPLSLGLLAFMDEHYRWLAGYLMDPAFMLWTVILYLGLWMLSPTNEHPWRELMLPTFFLLYWQIQDFFSQTHAFLSLSLAFTWTMGAHVAMRRYPEWIEQIYAQLIKLRLLRIYPWAFLAIKFIAVGWAVVGIALLPVLLFRMAQRYCMFYAAAAISAGVLLCNVRSPEGSTQGMLFWVLGVVFCIQILQTMSQRLADAVLKKLQA